MIEDAIDWLNENSGAIQALATIVLVAVTGVYVVLTKGYVDSTKRLADEARGAREDAVRPLIAIELASGDDINPGKYATCKVLNVGPGAALDVTVNLFDDTKSEVVEEKWGIFQSGYEKPSPRRFAIEKIPGRIEGVVIRYSDVFGRQWVSEFSPYGEADTGRMRVRQVL